MVVDDLRCSEKASETHEEEDRLNFSFGRVTLAALPEMESEGPLTHSAQIDRRSGETSK